MLTEREIKIALGRCDGNICSCYNCPAYTACKSDTFAKDVLNLIYQKEVEPEKIIAKFTADLRKELQYMPSVYSTVFERIIENILKKYKE